MEPARSKAHQGSLDQNDLMAPSQDDLERAITRFQESGDVQAALRDIGLEDQEPIIVIQFLLSLAGTRDIRDALEDMGLVAIGKAPPPAVPSAERLQALSDAAANAYGPDLSQLVPLDSVITGLARLCGCLPPDNAVIAAIGIIAERSVDHTITVSQSDLGSDARFFEADCEICGGNGQGQGWIYCASCLQRAEAVFGPVLDHVPLDPDNDRDTIVRGLLREKKDDFGCAACKNNPVKRCSCHFSIELPPNLTDGYILPVSRGSSKTKRYGCVRIRAAD